MKLRILHKVFLALFLTAGLSLAAMMLLVQWSLGRGFLDYINEVEQERVAQLADELAEEYTLRDKHWDWIGDGRIWRRMTRPERGPTPASPADRKPKGGPGRPKRDDDRARGREPPPRNDASRASREQRPDKNPPERRPPAGPAPVNLHTGARISLFDANRQKVIGRAREMSDDLFTHPISVDSQTVGWLTLNPLKKVSASRDNSFLQAQSRELLVIALLLLVASSLLAVILAGHVTKPLQAITDVVKQLVGGRYSSRVNAHGHDEISTLSSNIDTLALTLEDNQQARQRWIADISHELRTPVAILRAELEALKEGVRPTTSQAIDSIHAETLKLNKLIDDLHELSLSDIGAMAYQMTDVDLAYLVDDAIQQFSPRYEDHGIELDYNCDTQQQWSIKGDALRILQLLTNLFENSLRYTDSGGKLEIRLNRRQNLAVLTFADTAPGVHVDDCDRLFDRLYRADKSRNRVKGGSGLGLSICKSIVTAHDGEIFASASRLGGLKITVQLPLTGKQL